MLRQQAIFEALLAEEVLLTRPVGAVVLTEGADLVDVAPAPDSILSTPLAQPVWRRRRLRRRQVDVGQGTRK